MGKLMRAKYRVIRTILADVLISLLPIPIRFFPVRWAHFWTLKKSPINNAKYESTIKITNNKYRATCKNILFGRRSFSVNARTAERTIKVDAFKASYVSRTKFFEQIFTGIYWHLLSHRFKNAVLGRLEIVRQKCFFWQELERSETCFWFSCGSILFIILSEVRFIKLLVFGAKLCCKMSDLWGILASAILKFYGWSIVLFRTPLPTAHYRQHHHHHHHM